MIQKEFDFWKRQRALLIEQEKALTEQRAAIIGQRKAIETLLNNEQPVIPHPPIEDNTVTNRIAHAA